MINKLQTLFMSRRAVFCWSVPTILFGTLFMILFIEFKNPLFFIIAFLICLAWSILLTIHINKLSKKAKE